MTATLLSVLQGNQPLTTVPDYLKSEGPSPMAGGLEGNSPRDRIGFKGNRFRLISGGLEVATKDENHLDVTVVTANPHVSRMYYAGKYDPEVKAAPDCFSADGITPFAGAANKQANKCNGCPQNIKGSATTDNNKKTRACSFSKRLVVVLDGDADNNLYQVDLKSMSIFGEGIPSKGLYTLSGYSRLLQNRGVRVEGITTRMSFDTESSVPKLYFTPQGFLPEARVKEILKLSKSAEALEMATIDSVTVTPDLDVAVSGTQVPVPPKAQPKAAEPFKVNKKATASPEQLSLPLEDSAETTIVISDDDALRDILADLEA